MLGVFEGKKPSKKEKEQEKESEEGKRRKKKKKRKKKRKKKKKLRFFIYFARKQFVWFCFVFSFFFKSASFLKNIII